MVILACSELLLGPVHVVAQPFGKPEGFVGYLQVIVVEQIILFILLHSWILAHDICGSPISFIPLLDWLLRLIVINFLLILDDDAIVDGVVVIGFILLVELPDLLAVMEDLLYVIMLVNE